MTPDDTRDAAALLAEWVDAERAYWDHVAFIQAHPDPGRAPDFGPFERWKAAQSAAHTWRVAFHEASQTR